MLILPLLQVKSHVQGAAYGMERNPGKYRKTQATLGSIGAGLHSKGLVSGELKQGVTCFISQLQASFVPNVESTRRAILYAKQYLMVKASLVILID